MYLNSWVHNSYYTMPKSRSGLNAYVTGACLGVCLGNFIYSMLLLSSVEEWCKVKRIVDILLGAEIFYSVPVAVVHFLNGFQYDYEVQVQSTWGNNNY